MSVRNVQDWYQSLLIVYESSLRLLEREGRYTVKVLLPHAIGTVFWACRDSKKFLGGKEEEDVWHATKLTSWIELTSFKHKA